MCISQLYSRSQCVSLLPLKKSYTPGRQLSEESACCLSLRTWVQILRTHVKPGRVAFIYNPSVPTGKQETSVAHRSANLAYAEVSKSRQKGLVSGKGQYLKLTSDHAHAMAHVPECTHTHEYVHTHTCLHIVHIHIKHPKPLFIIKNQVVFQTCCWVTIAAPSQVP